MEPIVSKGNSGKVKLEYLQNDEKRTALWEPVKGGLIETVFDSDGAILRQVLLPECKENDVTCHINRLIGQAKTTDGKYSDIRLNGKKCPHCGSASIDRLASTIDDHKKAPVMPIYVCSECKGQSYYLTDSYLEQLIGEGKGFFDEKELKQMEGDRVAFVHELREYIIRIFASKRIMRIR